MKSKLKIYFAVGLVVALGLIGVALWFVRGAHTRLEEAHNGQEQRWLRTAAVFKKDPFPSNTNVRVLQDNVESIEQAFDALATRLAEGQAQPMDLSPGKFINLLHAKKGALHAAAASNLVAVTPSFEFGFEAYAERQIPWGGEVGRLTQQLQIIEALCRAMYDARVASITEITRETFERSTDGDRSPTPSAGGGRSIGFAAPAPSASGAKRAIVNEHAGLIPEGRTFGRFVFRLRFQATEMAVLAFLDHLSAHDMFIVVDHLSFDNGGTGVLPPIAYEVGPDGRPQPGGRRRARNERIVSGDVREQPTMVTMRLSVFQFRQPNGANGEESSG